jgi:hypothetical protein
LKTRKKHTGHNCGDGRQPHLADEVRTTIPISYEYRNKKGQEMSIPQ